MISGCPAPLAKRSTFTLSESLRFIASATMAAMIIATNTGSL